MTVASGDDMQGRYRLSYDEVTKGLVDRENRYTELPESEPSGEGFHTTVRLEHRPWRIEWYT